MSGIEETTETVRRAIVYAIVLYFAILLYAYATNDPLAYDVSQALFGVVVVIVGGLLVRLGVEERTTMLAAGICLLAGGVAQFGWLASREYAFNLVAQLAVFLGIGIYVYVVWIGE